MGKVIDWTPILDENITGGNPLCFT